MVVSPNLFWKELLRDQGLTIGRLDSRYLGIDKKVAGIRPDYNAEIPAWVRSFAPAANNYYSQNLHFKTDVSYRVLSGEVFPWNSDNNHTGVSLRKAMQENPSLHVLVQSGYYDGSICNFFNTKYTMWQLATSENLEDRMTWKGYPAGHMIYMDKALMVKANQDIRDFIINTIPAKGEGSHYSLSPKESKQ